MTRLILLTLALVAAGCTSQQTLHDTDTPLGRLRQSLDESFDDPQFDNAHWGVLIRSLKTGETVYARNERKMFMPASNLKLLTSSAAMMTLSPDYRYTTRLAANGPVKEGVLAGDLVIVGSGDPTISGRYNDGRVTETFEQWADSLLAKGIRRIDGGIIGDDNAFEDEPYGDGWSADYETDYYAAQMSALTFNDNCVDVRLVPSAVTGDICSLSVVPNTKYVTFINQTVTAPAEDSVNNIWFHRVRGTNTVYVRGRMSPGKPAWLESVAIDNPTLYAATVLREVLIAKGIAVGGPAQDVDDRKDSLKSAGLPVLATFTSVPYSVIVRTINKPSHNLYTEQVLRTMGKERSGDGVGSVRAGHAVALPVLASWGVDTVRLRYADGSGLSRLNLVTPKDIVAILEGMHAGPHFLPFYESLPIAGVDGSIRNRMKGTKAEGNVHAKTGFIGYVRALSGYVTSADGEMFVFSMIANHYTVPTRVAEKVQNDVCVRLAGFSR